MQGRNNPCTIMEEEEDQYSSQNENISQQIQNRKFNNQNLQFMNEKERNIQYQSTLLMNQQNRQGIGFLNIIQNENKQQQQLNNEGYIEQEMDCQKIEEKETDKMLDEIKQLLEYDESLYDLMRHKSHFKFSFAKEFEIFNQIISGFSQQSQENEIVTGINQIVNNYVCFNDFFFHKQYLYQKSVLEIHHSQTMEKNQLINFMIAELLRDQAGKELSDQKTIAPEILYFDNTQQINYLQIKQMIKMKLSQINYYKQQFNQSQLTSSGKDEGLDAIFENVSENCLSKLHVIESHNQIQFCANIRSLKHILNKNKSIRVVIIDEINAFFVDNENQYQHSRTTPSKEEDENQQNKKKKKKNTTTHHKSNIPKQYDLIIKDYLNEIYQRYTRVAFIQTRRDYFKVRNLIEYYESNQNIFKANDELVQLLQKDDIDMTSQLYKNNKDYEFSNIYCLSLDNVSNQALEKILEIIRNNQMNSDAYINPQKVSIVVKRNYHNDDQNEEALILNEYAYQMNFYSFEKGEFKPLTDSTYYFS